jgi:hypothetical protein
MMLWGKRRRLKWRAILLILWTPGSGIVESAESAEPFFGCVAFSGSGVR